MNNSTDNAKSLWLIIFSHPALVAQGIEHWFPVPKVGGSNPLEGTIVNSKEYDFAESYRTRLVEQF